MWFRLSLPITISAREETLSDWQLCGIRRLSVQKSRKISTITDKITYFPADSHTRQESCRQKTPRGHINGGAFVVIFAELVLNRIQTRSRLEADFGREQFAPRVRWTLLASTSKGADCWYYGVKGTAILAYLAIHQYFMIRATQETLPYRSAHDGASRSASSQIRKKLYVLMRLDIS